MQVYQVAHGSWQFEPAWPIANVTGWCVGGAKWRDQSYSSNCCFSDHRKKIATLNKSVWLRIIIFHHTDLLGLKDFKNYCLGNTF